MTWVREIHRTVYKDSGHELSVDCWCEPVDIKLTQADPPILIVTHNDNIPAPHDVVIWARENHKHLASPDFQENDFWITRLLDLGPSQLPPMP